MVDEVLCACAGHYVCVWGGGGGEVTVRGWGGARIDGRCTEGYNFVFVRYWA